MSLGHSPVKIINLTDDDHIFLLTKITSKDIGTI